MLAGILSGRKWPNVIKANIHILFCVNVYKERNLSFEGYRRREQRLMLRFATTATLDSNTLFRTCRRIDSLKIKGLWVFREI
jgi:hypothetical protein